MESGRFLLFSFFAWLLTSFRECGYSPVAVFVHTSYDETPLILRVTAEKVDKGAGGRLAANKAKIAKTSQTDIFIVLLIRGPAGLVHYKLLIPTKLQVMDHSTAENTKTCIEEHLHKCGFYQFAAQWPMVFWISCHDRAASNLKYEACQLRDKGEKDVRLSLPCDVHRISGISGAQWNQISLCISGAISFAISQRPAGALECLRACIAMWLRTRCQIIRGGSLPPSAASLRHRDAMLDLCSSIPKERQAVIRGFFNVDWCKSDPAHFHWDGCTCCDGTPEGFETLIDGSITTALVPGLTVIFPRHRWTNAQLTTDELILLTSCHRCYKRVVPVWLTCMRQKRDPTPRDFPAVAEEVVDPSGQGLSEDDLGPRGLARRPAWLNEIVDCESDEAPRCNGCYTQLHVCLESPCPFASCLLVAPHRGAARGRHSGWVRGLREQTNHCTVLTTLAS
jgi:hypothetical protein